MQKSVKSNPSIVLKIFFFLFMAILLAVALLLASLFWLNGTLTKQSTQHELTTQTTIKHIVIGNDIINIPANMMRFAKQRNAQTLKQADLILFWPNGTGYTQKIHEEIEQSGFLDSMIFITLNKRRMAYAMTERLEPIYKKIFRGPAENGPNGLIIQPLIKGAGYDGEKLMIEKATPVTFVARCQNKEDNLNPTCMRDFFAGKGLNVSYRFPRALLPHWQIIEKQVRTTISTMILQ